MLVQGSKRRKTEVAGPLNTLFQKSPGSCFLHILLIRILQILLQVNRDKQKHPLTGKVECVYRKMGLLRAVFGDIVVFNVSWDSCYDLFSVFLLAFPRTSFSIVMFMLVAIIKAKQHESALPLLLLAKFVKQLVLSIFYILFTQEGESSYPCNVFLQNI